MTELVFNNKLVNLEYSLYREFLSTNRIGGYMCSTITCCNTRKYHGLMICPVPERDNRNYLLLSSMDETILQNGHAFNLAVHQFPGVFYPKGNKYITGFSYSPIPAITYTVGDIQLKKEMIWMHSRNHLLIRYTLLRSSHPITLRVRPMLAYREVDTLSKANMEANGTSIPIDNGVKCVMYPGLPALYMQTNIESEFLSAPDWYYNYEYQRDKEAGEPYREDLFSIGVFETGMKEGEQLVLSCSSTEIPSRYIDRLFDEEVRRRSDKSTFRLCLEHAARQFMIQKKDGMEIVSGYPWRDVRTRDALIALPDLTLANNRPDWCIEALDRMVRSMQNGVFTEDENGGIAADTSLWLFYTLQRIENVVSRRYIWERYGKVMKGILTAYSGGVGEERIIMHDNGLIWAEPTGDGTDRSAYSPFACAPFRSGYLVDVCALWYNAVCYALELSAEFGDFVFQEEWKGFDERIRKSFGITFAIEGEDYLADYVNDEGQNRQIRGNQLIACGLQYKPINEAKILSVLNVVARHLKTPRGLRTLSPTDLQYIGIGDLADDYRKALCNGGLSLWLTAFFIQAEEDARGEDAEEYARKLVEIYKEDFFDFGLANMAEMYDGDPPYHPRGAVSCATSVAAMLNILDKVQRFSDKNKKLVKQD